MSYSNGKRRRKRKGPRKTNVANGKPPLNASTGLPQRPPSLRSKRVRGTEVEFLQSLLEVMGGLL